MITFTQSKNIEDFRPLIDTLIPDFGTSFLYTILQWCGLATNTDSENKFWEVWLIKYDKSVIGICGLYSLNPKNTDELWLGWLGLIPEKRNSGLGKDIMSHLYNEAKKVNCNIIYSYVDEEGKPLNFYKREGFEIISNVRDFLKNNYMSYIDGDDFESPDDWVIRKKI